MTKKIQIQIVQENITNPNRKFCWGKIKEIVHDTTFLTCLEILNYRGKISAQLFLTLYGKKKQTNKKVILKKPHNTLTERILHSQCKCVRICKSN